GDDNVIDEQAWTCLRPLVLDYWQRVQTKVEPRHAPGRMKQWLNLLRRNYPQAEVLYQSIRPLRMPQDVDLHLRSA
ncbi:MAG TPA: dihydrouridine synthase, partial [Rhodocyclaceae bacterium]|nr:dihydrouridine synthase [Rhodocyclaceae bacterium]